MAKKRPIPPEVRAILDDIEAAFTMADDVKAAKALARVMNTDPKKGPMPIPTLQGLLRMRRQEIVVNLHEGEKMPWPQVGSVVGVHWARAAQIYRGVSGGAKKSKKATQPSTDAP